MVKLVDSIQSVHTMSRGNTEWGKWTLGARNSLQAVICSLICKIGNKCFGPIYGLWNRHIAYRVFILCPAGWVDGVNRLSGAQNSVQPLIFSRICKIGNECFGPIWGWCNCRIAYRVVILCPAGWGDGVNRLSGAQNSLQPVIFSLICKIGNKLLGPILAQGQCRIAYRVFILCPAGRENGVNELSSAQNSLQPVIFQSHLSNWKEIPQANLGMTKPSYSIQCSYCIPRDEGMG